MGKKIGELIWMSAGAGIAMALVFLLASDRFSPLILASLAGSAVYLFALTDADESQPRALFGGQLGSTIISILCFQMLGDARWVSVVAFALVMAFMVITRTIHPPAGMNPLVLIPHHAGYIALLNPVAVGVVVLFIVTIGWSRLRPGKKYPNKWW